MNENTEIQNALDPVILYRVDAEKGDGKELAKEFKIRAYPTFIMVNKDGQMIDIWLGYDKGYFTRTLADARADLSTIDEKKARYLEKPDMHSTIVLGRYSSALRQHKDAVAYYQQAQMIKTDPGADYSFDIFENTADGIGQKDFTYDDAAKAADVMLATQKNDTWGIINVSDRMIAMAKEIGKQQDVAKYIQAGLDATATTDNPDLKRMHTGLMVQFALDIKGDTASALEYKKSSMKEDWQNDSNGLNEFAWWCFENKTNLKEAEKLSEKSIKLAKPGRGKANNLDTLAEIKYALGKKKEAVELEKKAVQEDPKNSEFPLKVERFQKALEKK